jgi:WD40 repeat protein
MADWLTGGVDDTHDSACKLGYNDLRVSALDEGHEVLSEKTAKLVDTEREDVSVLMNAALGFAARHRFYHLCKIEEFVQATEVVLNLDKLLSWLQASRIGDTTTNNPTIPMLKDIEEQLIENQVANAQNKPLVRQAKIVAKVLRLGSSAIGEDARAIAGQIVGRLSVEDVADESMKRVKQLRNQAWMYKPSKDAQESTAMVQWVRPLTPCLETAMPSALIRVFHGHSQPVQSVGFSSDGSTFASGSWKGAIRLWDAETGEAKLSGKELVGHSNSVFVVAFSPDGKLFASGSLDKNVRLWDAETGEAKFDGNALEGM